MAIKHHSTIGFWLLAIALFGATPNATSFAEEVRSGAPRLAERGSSVGSFWRTCRTEYIEL